MGIPRDPEILLLETEFKEITEGCVQKFLVKG